ncbi:hypothetical protein DVH05_003277 [Phytophthora capsici]|nr:hypothetical protein DVH05_003277 [Phytophthora capsici]
MEEFAKQLPGITDFADIVDKYVMLAHLDGDYFLCNHQDMKDAAELTLSDRFTFCMSPVSLRNPLKREWAVRKGSLNGVAANPARAEETFINKHPTLSALDQKIVDLTAQYKALSGRSFLPGLAIRGQHNPQFDLPTHTCCDDSWSIFVFGTRENYRMKVLG